MTPNARTVMILQWTHNGGSTSGMTQYIYGIHWLRGTCLYILLADIYIYVETMEMILL